MSTFKDIRTRLNLTQQGLADALGCTQAAVSLCDRGQTLQPPMAIRLIEVAKAKGFELTMDQVYGLAPLPEAPAPQEEQGVSNG